MSGEGSEGRVVGRIVRVFEGEARVEREEGGRRFEPVQPTGARTADWWGEDDLDVFIISGGYFVV